MLVNPVIYMNIKVERISVKHSNDCSILATSMVNGLTSSKKKAKILSHSVVSKAIIIDKHFLMRELYVKPFHSSNNPVVKAMH